MIYVCVPHDQVEKYQHVGWSAMLAAAAEGVDGLERVEVDPLPNTRVPLYRKDGYSTFRDGAGEVRTPDVALLHTR